MGGCVSIHTVKIRVPAVVQTRGESNVYDSDELGLDPVVIHVSQPLLVS